MQIIPRLIIGKHYMGGFDGLSDGDYFNTTDGKLWKLASTGSGWTLREAKPDGSADYSRPPHPDFTGVPSYQDFVFRVNGAADQYGAESWPV